jgi:hypothetical protein
MYFREPMGETRGVHSKSIERWKHNSIGTEELHEMLIESPSQLLDEIGEWLAIYMINPYR